MAKKKRRRAAVSTLTTAQLAAIAPATTPPTKLITVPAGGTLAVIVDVGPMTIPYTVSYAGRTLIKSLVDRAAPVPLINGDQVLGWAFSHATKGWHHRIAVSVNSGTPTVLESMSEANKDQDHSVNFAIVRS
jgi:hypothetical protein